MKKNDLESELKNVTDSITSKINIFTIDNNKILLKADKNNLFFNNTKPYIVYKNNKIGFYNTNYTEIIPIKYDAIGFNGMILQNKNFNYPNQIKDYFVIRENEKYGILKVIQNRDSKLYEVEYFTKPTFKNYPVFYYNDYYGIKNLKLIKVIDDAGILLQFCDEKGNCY